MIDLYDELRAIARSLDQGQIPYALVGGLAVSIYATPRATQDVDLLVAPGDVARIAVALGVLDYRDLTAPMLFAGGRIEIRRFTKLAGADFLAVDLLLARDPAELDILARREAVGDDDHRLWLAPIDGLRALKRLRGSPQDLADLAALDAAEGTQ